MKTLLMTLALAFSATAFSADKPMTTQLDDLIRGEMSAVKVYNQVLEKVKDPAEVKKLTAIRTDHQNAVAALKKYANAEVKEDTQTVGPWGTFTEAWVGSAKLMGNETALKALRQGEEHGMTEYKEALEDKAISADLKGMIKTKFMPQTESHIKALNAFTM